MKVVLNTNVFVSGVFFSGPPYQILSAWKDGKIALALSAEILAEYRRAGTILSDDHQNIDLNPMLAYLEQHAEIVNAPPLSERVCEDPDDDKFFACALASGCNVIVSGDKHLLKVSGYQDIKVFKPREFVEEYLRG